MNICICICIEKTGCKARNLTAGFTFIQKGLYLPLQPGVLSVPVWIPEEQ